MVGLWHSSGSKLHSFWSPYTRHVYLLPCDALHKAGGKSESICQHMAAVGQECAVSGFNVYFCSGVMGQAGKGKAFWVTKCSTWCTVLQSAVFVLQTKTSSAQKDTHHVVTRKKLLQEFRFLVHHSFYDELIIACDIEERATGTRVW